MPRFSSPRRAGALLGACVLAILSLSAAGCGGSSSSSSGFAVKSSKYALDGRTDMVVSGSWLVFFASEVRSSDPPVDLTGDGDAMDDDGVAIAVNISKRKEYVIGVVAESAAIVGSDIYLEVDEADDHRIWDATPGDQRVLLHWSLSAGMLTYVGTFNPATLDVAMLEVGGRLYYSADVAIAGDETTLQMVETSAPTASVPVLNQDMAGGLSPILMGEDNGLIFLLLDETVELMDLNNDTVDMTDPFVLALLDGTDAAGRIKNVGKAVVDEEVPFAARSSGNHDWLVGFLVNEAFENDMYNDAVMSGQAILPLHCGPDDSDMDDDVLFYLEFANFLTDTGDFLVNTGLAGVDKVVVIDDYVATLSPEGDADCDLNDDTDSDDFIPRWVEAVATIQPPRLKSQMVAVDRDLPGGSMGFVSLGNRLVAVVDEAQDSRDYDHFPSPPTDDFDLVAWLDPSDGFSTDWVFSHQHPSVRNFGTGIFDSGNDSEPYAGASWMAAEEQYGRIAIAFQEEVPGTNPDIDSLNTNLDCSFVAKDMDKTDSLPTWCDFEAGPTLDFDGLGIAVVDDEAGMVITPGTVFFRVSEADDNINYNSSRDSDKFDSVLMRNPLTTCIPRVMGVCTDSGGPVVVTDGVRGGAFLADEAAANEEYNGDQTSDVVVRYFTF